MTLSQLTDGFLGPLEDQIDFVSGGMLWRNRAIQEIIEEIALLGIIFSYNASYYPNLTDRGFIAAIIEKTTNIYSILDIIARGGFASFAADLF